MHQHPVRTVSLPGGLGLACRTTNDGGIPCLFIHGYSMSLDCWDRALDLLPARYRGIAYDLRGFGRSQWATSYTLDDHAADITALMDALGITRAVLIGHSLGGTIAQMAAIAEPDRVAALVLTNCRARNLAPPDPVAGEVDKRKKAYGTREENRKVLESRMTGYFDPSNVTPDEISRFVEIGAGADPKALGQTLHELYHHPIIDRARFSAYTGPVLAVCGESDALTPLEVAAPLKEVLPQAEFVMIEASGHSPMWEKPREWSGKVYGFLDRAV